MSMVNLLPRDYLACRMQKRANTICIILFLIVMGGVGMAALVSEHTTGNTREVLERVNASYSEAAKMLTQMRQLEASKKQMITKAKTTASLLERVPRSYLLAMVSQALPDEASVTRVELRPGKAKSKPRSPKGSKFEAAKNKSADKEPTQNQMPPMILDVTGLAATDMQVGSLIANLKDNPLLSSVDISYSQSKTLNERSTDKPKIDVREFKVTMELRPNVDVIDLLRERRAKETADAAGTLVEPGAES